MNNYNINDVIAIQIKFYGCILLIIYKTIGIIIVTIIIILIILIIAINLIGIWSKFTGIGKASTTHTSGAANTVKIG